MENNTEFLPLVQGGKVIYYRTSATPDDLFSAANDRMLILNKLGDWFRFAVEDSGLSHDCASVFGGIVYTLTQETQHLYMASRDAFESQLNAAKKDKTE